jgi:hypothetical protein
VSLSSINGSEKVARMWKVMKEAIAHHLTELIKMLKSAESGAFRQSVKLIM